MAISYDSLITHFYEAFKQRDYQTMQQYYHEEARFSDPVFQNLNAQEVRKMWEMLLTSAKDLRIEFRDVQFDGEAGSCHWEAWYTFTATGRKVHNKIDAEFQFKDGKMYRHSDHFDFWRWSRMALGPTGVLLGWSPIVLNKVRKTARGRLERFMSKK
jgi:ketosteroid isomerase-like protein